MSLNQLTATAMAVVLAVVGTLVFTSNRPIQAANSASQPQRFSKVKAFIAAHNGHFSMRTGSSSVLNEGTIISNADSDGWADYTYTYFGGNGYRLVEAGVINLSSGTTYSTSTATYRKPAR